jgi:hypothetical protein
MEFEHESDACSAATAIASNFVVGLTARHHSTVCQRESKFSPCLFMATDRPSCHFIASIFAF